MTDIEELIEKAKKYELEGLGVLDAFTTEEIGGIYNGIGPDRFPDWLRKIITDSAGVFEPAALIHDVDYHLGGDKEKFHEDNERFRRNCYKIVEQTVSWWNPLLRLALLNRARRWANYCEMFGWDGYNKNE